MLGLAAFVVSALPFTVLRILLPITLLGSPGSSSSLALPAVHAQSTATPDQEGAPPFPTPQPRPRETGRPENPWGPSPAPAYPFQPSVVAKPPLPPQAASAVLVAMLSVALIWRLIYAPVALTVAAISRSVLSTLNPIVGFGTIASMGAIYWQAALIYLVISIMQFIADFPLGFIPILGGLVASFVDAYAMLSIACALGLAVFKKARELNLE
jgi:hypothetical protein